MFARDEELPIRSIMDRGKATPEEATWTCRVCGVIEPHQARFNQKWFPSRCQCQIDAVNKKREEEEHQRRIRVMVDYCYLWLGSNWSDKPLVEKTFETFQQALQKDAYDLARLFSIDLEGTLVLHGSYGTGKTHLLAAICNEIRTRGIESRFTTAPKLFKAIQERIQYNEEYTSLLHKAAHTPLLVIDDIDKAKTSEFREEIYFEIVDERAKRGLPIAISTNSLEDLASYVGGAVCSRLSIGQIAIEMTGIDYRPNL